jgi:hypothetical protein
MGHISQDVTQLVQQEIVRQFPVVAIGGRTYGGRWYEEKVSLRVLPFGSIIYITAPTVPPMKEQLPDMPRYTEPLTTNIEKIEIRYGEGETYSVPRTTACM